MAQFPLLSGALIPANRSTMSRTNQNREAQSRVLTSPAPPDFEVILAATIPSSSKSMTLEFLRGTAQFARANILLFQIR
jgi:hypothetical protein